ncbi:MAG TPA: hypothetical protein PKZ64_06115 [Spirochaetota bacterium]|nr:hypothetical protein [Spirochaetota bacterium]HPJ40700.1 hypothetical protein [Spirochaetota bacterium]
MDLENIIKKIVDKNFSTYEQERLTVLNALLGNIDILMNKADGWFGDDIPEEYSRVIRSLFSLSAFLLEKKHSSFEISRIDKYQEINIHQFLTQFVNELKNILDLGEMNISAVDAGHEPVIRTSEVILRDAFYNIFFSVYPFMKKDSSCMINLNENRLNISIEFIFEKLSPIFPGATEIKKNIYSYRHGDLDKIGIGIDSATDNLRNAGAIVRINELPFKDRFSLSIMFPALEFYTGLEHIREHSQQGDSRKYDGDIAIHIADPFMKLFITDTLHECGYNVIQIPDNELNLHSLSGGLKAFIIEYDTAYPENTKALISINNLNFKKIVICSENDIISTASIAEFTKIIKPFNIEELIDRIENG